VLISTEKIILQGQVKNHTSKSGEGEKGAIC